MSSSTDNLEATMTDGKGLMVIPLVVFLFWNGLFGYPTTLAFSMLFRGKCDPMVTLLLFPTWYVGIILPIWLGFVVFGVLGALGFGFVDVILPYSCWAVYFTVYDKEVRAIPCCSCFRSTPGSNDSNEAANTLEVPVGSADVIESEENDDSDKKTKEILILKKVVNQQDDLMVEKDADESFRFNRRNSLSIRARVEINFWTNKALHLLEKWLGEYSVSLNMMVRLSLNFLHLTIVLGDDSFIVVWSLWMPFTMDTARNRIKGKSTLEEMSI
jgi:hypothetical protein